jgi:uncharacterized protein (TIGR03067 family)
MRRVMGVLLAAGWLALSVAWAGGGDDAKQLEGTWQVVESELAGKEFPLPKETRLILKDGTYTLRLGEKSDKGTYKVDPKKTPRTMNITGTEGPNKGKTYLTIYELKGDTLRVCYDLGGKDRPKEFSTKGSPLHYMVVYKRVKEGK